MKLSEIKNCIDFRVQELNKITGENYIVEYRNGGCRLYQYVNGCEKSSNYGNTMYRRKNGEMLAYLEGLLSGLMKMKY